MYNGNMVEWGTKDQILSAPAHPYTVNLMSSILRMDGKLPQVKTILREKAAQGCVFYARCPKACDQCRCAKPEMRTVEDGHMVMCHLAEKEAGNIG